MKLASLERVIALLGWLATASAGVLLLTQAVGWNGSTLLAALHALTPYLLAVTIPVAGVANWRKRHGLAVTSSVVGLGRCASTLDILIDGPDEPIRIFGVHPSTPISNFDGWIADLATFGKLGSPETDSCRRRCRTSPSQEAITAASSSALFQLAEQLPKRTPTM